MNELKYLDLDGLEFFKSKLDNQRTEDKTELVGLLNDISDNIKDGTFTIQKNGVTIATFNANLSSDVEANLIVPTSIADFNDSILYIKNIILYGQSNISELTEELKEALHEQSAENLGLISENKLELNLTNYGTIINYDSARQYILLKNGNNILSEFSAADFIKDGMIEDIRITQGTGSNVNKQVLLIDFNTSSGITDIEIPLDNIFKASDYTKTEDLASVAISGSWNDLIDKPTIPEGSVIDANFDISSGNSVKNSTITGFILNTLPNLIENVIRYGIPNITGKTLEELNLLQESSEFALKSNLFSRDYNDLINKPTLFSGSYNDLTNKPLLFSGSYDDLTNKPNIPSALILSDWNQSNNLSLDFIKNKPIVYTKQEIENIIKYGYPDVGGMSDSEKEEARNSSEYALKSDLFSRNYNDLTNKPTLFSGSYNDLTDKPTIPTIPTNVSAFINDSGYLTLHLDISGKANSSDLAIIATTGSYNDLIDKPVIPVIPTNISAFINDSGYLTQHQDISGKANISELAEVATSGSYNDLIDKPNIPSLAGYATELWIQQLNYLTSQDISGKANSSDLAVVATSGSYDDLINKPTIISNYNGLNYTGSSITSNGGTVTINGSTNIFKITTSASISGITLNAVPENYHSCHVIITVNSSSENVSVSVSNGALITIEETTYTLVCPRNNDILLSISSGEYIEFDFIRIDNELFVRGI